MNSNAVSFLLLFIIKNKIKVCKGMGFHICVYLLNLTELMFESTSKFRDLIYFPRIVLSEEFRMEIFNQ